jgi:hypothetical protein
MDNSDEVLKTASCCLSFKDEDLPEDLPRHVISWQKSIPAPDLRSSDLPQVSAIITQPPVFSSISPKQLDSVVGSDGILALLH